MLNKVAIPTICLHLLLVGSALGRNPLAPAVSQQSSKPQAAPAAISVVVLDHNGQPVTELDQSEIQIFVNKERVPVESVSHAPDAPAEIAILIDTSNSGRGFLQDLRWKDDTEPTAQLVRSGDRACVATFSEVNRLISPMTSDVAQIRAALHTAIFEAPPGRGTALYDAMFSAATAAYSSQSSHKALVVLSDMGDNQSFHTRSEVAEQAKRLGIRIFPIIPLAQIGASRREEWVAKSLASLTGGTDYVVKPGQLRTIFAAISADIREIYTISFRPKCSAHGPLKIQCTRKGVKIVALEQTF